MTETIEDAQRRLTAERHVLIAAALAQSLERFDAFAAMDSPELPADATDAMQVRLYRWQVSRFGLQSDERFALGIIEELGETFEAEDGEHALDGLGDVCVYAAQLCTNNRLALGPILDLARVFQARQEVQPLLGVGKLAHAVLKHAQNIRGKGNREVYRLSLVECVALCVAKAIDDCEVMHSLEIKSTPHVFAIVGTTVLARGAGHEAIPATCTVEESELHITPRPDDGPVLHVRLMGDDGRMHALETLQTGAELLGEAEKSEPGDFDVSDVRASMTDGDLAELQRQYDMHSHVPHSRICPQCSGLLSDGDDNGTLVCSNGHEITGKQMAALPRLPIPGV